MTRPKSRVCRVVMTGPLAPFADAYELALKGRGYTPLTMVSQPAAPGRPAEPLARGERIRGHRPEWRARRGEVGLDQQVTDDGGSAL